MSDLLGTVQQDPSESLYYGIDMSAQLEGDTVSTAVWDTPAGLTATGTGSASGTSLTTPRWRGGESGLDYCAEVTVTTTTRLETLQGHVLIQVR